MPTLDPATEAAILTRSAALLLHERQASDPLLQWQPHPKQQLFIDSVLEARYWENWLCCANRFGKTRAGAYCGATLARFGVEPQRSAYSEGGRIEVRDRATAGWVMGLDSNTLRDVVQPNYFDNGFLQPGAPDPFIPAREILEWRPGDQILKLKNGSFVGYKGCEAPALKVTGGAKDWVHIDEPPPKSHYDELLIRVGAGRRFRLFATCTLLPPEGHVETISWVYSEIIAPILEGRTTDIGLFRGSIYDNPYLDGQEVKRLESRYPPGSLARRIRLLGELIPGVAGALVYANFARQIHVRAQPSLSPHRPLCWNWDFNVAPFCSTVGQREPDLFRVYREFVLDEGNIGEMCAAFKAAFPSHPHELWIYGDATGGNQHHQTAHSSYDLILAELQTYPSPVRLKVPEANPLVVDRVNAVNMALKDAYGASHVVIHPSCQETIADFEQTLADPHGGIKKTYNRRDPYSRRTHLTDGIGGWIVVEAPVRQARTQPGRGRMPPSPQYGFQQPRVRQPAYGGR